MLHSALGSRCRYVLIALPFLVALTACDELKEVLGEEDERKEDLYGPYQLRFVKQTAQAQCDVTATTTGCEINGATVQVFVTNGDLWLNPDGPIFTRSANGNTNTGTNKHYSVDGTYLRSGNDVTLSSSGIVLQGNFNKPNMLITVPARLFNPDATAIATVLLTFVKQ